MDIDKRKELIKKFRSMVSNGQHVSRETLLAYAFLRGKPYNHLENVINEDKFERHPEWKELKMGLFCFLDSLAYYVAGTIKKADPLSSVSEKDDIYAWMLEKYKIQEKTEEKVA